MKSDLIQYQGHYIILYLFLNLALHCRYLTLISQEFKLTARSEEENTEMPEV